jgi:alginate O-acetyltransferase complex protein AlgI
MLGGMALGVVLALISPRLSDEILGLVGLIPLFLVIHLGYAGVLAAALRAVGYPVERLFDRPECSKSLRDFWSKRWNRPFVEMNKALFFKGRLVQASPQMALFLTFVMSGLLHEFGISFPAGRGWGLPTLYFMLHGALVLFEGQPLVGFKNWPPAIRRVWVWCAVLLPLPMLFHDAFRSALIVPLYREAGSILLAYSAIEYFSWLVPIAGIAHCLPLIGGSQLPSKLEWKSDLTKLKPFNRKIMWNYGAFIFLLIIAFGCETFIFREEMVRGDPAALGLAALIFGFWLLRVMVDLFYFSHSDWPEGPEFVIGHALLNSAFVFLIVVYGSLLGWHMLWR